MEIYLIFNTLGQQMVLSSCKMRLYVFSGAKYTTKYIAVINYLHFLTLKK